MEQRKRGRVTITDPRMTRFWLTIEEGVQFVISSIEMMQGGEVFVPRIPSMRMPDLAQAIAPGCEVEVTGIRPGEKLHEALVGLDEARNLLELPDRYIILPQHMSWRYSLPEQARKVEGDFSYTSDNNQQWLDQEGLLTMLSSTGALKAEAG
jgi:UDP-N-acetylglucosamine 4,6-dehydratase